MFLVGNTGWLIYGVSVTFDDEIIKAYSEIMSYLNMSYFSQFYSAENTMPSEEVKAALQSPKMKKHGVDIDSFDTVYGIWRYLNVSSNSCSQLLRFPLVSFSQRTLLFAINSNFPSASLL